MADFFQQYFIQPIITEGVAGYNAFNTPLYALGFALAVFGAYKLLKRLNIKIDRYFLAGILPYILAGGVWRVVRDARISESPLLVTPLIYFAVFAVAVAGLLISVGIEKFAIKTKLIKAKKGRAGEVQKAGPESASARMFSRPINFVPSSYFKVWCLIGLAVLFSGFIILAPLPIQNWNALGIIAGLSAVWAVVLFGPAYRIGPRIKALAVFTRENCGLLWAHLFDASTTFTALQFFEGAGYYEQHVVSNAVINALGPAGQFILKLAVLVPVLWLIDRELAKPEDAQLRGFIKIAILILGLAPGVRNGLRLALGV
ncbi:MAG: DUF63 family protein [Candidatus Aenigmatarchaeota archaeon]